MKKIKVAVIGCGLIGQRRARIIADHPASSLEIVVDSNAALAKQVSNYFGCRAQTDWKNALLDPEIDCAVIATPNYLLSPIACHALKQGKHVLIEKPMGKDLKDAKALALAAKRHRKKLKIGFNHRYHPALLKAYQIFKKGTIGSAINIRAQYGHGGRRGYEKEWRGNARMAGGGELTDQGVHLIDLVQWFCGKPSQAFALLQTAFWPIQPSEDNGFALLRYSNGMIANFHSSWTQWKNLFNFEIFGAKGSLSVRGLGGSYGKESLTITLRKKEGGAPDQTEEIFDGPDLSWKAEWNDFMTAIASKKDYFGTPEEGLAVMQTLDALYRSHRQKKMVSIS